MRLTLDTEEEGLPGGAFGLTHLPDGHLAFLRADTGYRMWISAGVRSHLFHGPSLDHLVPHRTDDGRAAAIFGPSGSGFDAAYAAFGGLLPTGPPGTLLGIYHGEQCGRGNYTATIGIAVSTDMGVTWRRCGAILTGRNPAPPGTRIAGAGIPAVVLHGRYAYVYYTDWSVDRPDETHVARAPIDRSTEPAAWRKFHDGAFGSPGIGGESTAVIRRPDPPRETVYAASATVAYNRAVGRFVAVFETSVGFFAAESADGLAWGKAQVVHPFPTPRTRRRPGSVWYGYPSLIGPSEPSSLTVAARGYLYYARGVFEREAHRMMRRPMAIGE
jgi:hypothetical protein